jgi:hypothetical protein
MKKKSVFFLLLFPLFLETLPGRLLAEERIKSEAVKQTAQLGGAQVLSTLIDKLADPALDSDKKQAIKRKIIMTGAKAIPLLIASLKDPRVYEKHRDVQNYYGLSPTQKMPEPIYADITVGEQCEDMLYEIITPRQYRSPYEKPIKAFSFQKLSVPDWEVWWRKNKGKSLEEIHHEMIPLVDRYWKEHGTTQMVR